MSDVDMRTMSQESWRVLRIMSELVEGFEVMSTLPPAVTIFGSSRTPERHEHYELARATAGKASPIATQTETVDRLNVLLISFIRLAPLLTWVTGNRHT